MQNVIRQERIERDQLCRAPAHKRRQINDWPESTEDRGQSSGDSGFRVNRTPRRLHRRTPYGKDRPPLRTFDPIHAHPVFSRPCPGILGVLVSLAFRCRSSVVEHSIGNGEVDSSILSGSTIQLAVNVDFIGNLGLSVTQKCHANHGFHPVENG